MIKILIKTTFFVFFVLFTATVLEPHFIKEDRFNLPKYKFEKIADTTNFGILFFGSSKSYCAYNPSIFKYNSKVNSFNLAGQGQVLEVTDFIIDEALRLNKPELILVDLSYGMIRFQKNDPDIDRKKSYQLKIFDNYGLSSHKLMHLSRIFNTKDFYYSLSPIVRNHEFWMEVPKQRYKRSFLADKNNMFLANNGYIGTMHKISKEGIEKANEMKLGYETLKNKRNLQVRDEELELISKIHKKASKMDVKVLFVTSPSIEGITKHLSFYENLESHLGTLGINYLNLNKHFEAIGLKVSDFKDHQHLNFHGGQKTSEFLSKLISKTYTFNSLAKRNLLDNNVTFNLLSNLDYTNEILATQFKFNEKITVDKIGYFEEVLDRYAFIFRFKPGTNKEELSDFRGYIRYYNGAIIDKNKKVNSFPLEAIEINNDVFVFARVPIEDTDISQFDVFFIDNKNKKPSKFLRLGKMSIKTNDLYRELL